MDGYMILLIDDNSRLRDELKELFSHDKNVSFYCCRTGEEAMAFFAEHSPDYAIVDMMMPGMDGAELITQCREKNLAVSTRFVGLSPLASEEVVKMTQKLGLAYFIAMPTTPEKIFKTMMRLIHVNGDAKSADVQPVMLEKTRDLEQERIVTNYLHLLGVPPHISGYRYLKAAIEYSIEHSGNRLSVTLDVYPAVAALCDSTAKRVERNIRTALDRAWFIGDIEMQHKLFGYTVNDNKGRPTNKECIAMLADRTMMRLKYR